MAKKSKDILSDDLFQLILSGHRKFPLFKGFAPNQNQLKKYTRGCVKAAASGGICDSHYSAGRLRAVFLVLNIELAPGLPFKWGFVETDRSAEAEKWALKTFKKYRSSFKGNVMLDLPVYLRAVMPQLYKIGFFVDTIRTVGEARGAYRKLMRLRNPAAKMEGYTISKVTSREQLQEIMRIERREFRRNPQYGFFVSSPAWLKHSYEQRKKSIRNARACLRVIRDGKRIVGYFGYSAQVGIFNGSFCGTEFIFDKSIQGKGFSFVAYRLLLEEMMKDKIKFFVGNTSQPAVLKAAVLMGRIPQNYALRFGKPYFAASHFESASLR